MVTYLSTLITSFLISKNVIKHSEEKIYHYGVLTLLVNLISVLEILILGWITNTLLVSFIYMIGFALLRSFTGGFHFRHYIPCNISYGCLYLLCAYMYFNIPNDAWIPNILSMLSLLVVYIMSPIIHINKPLDDKKKKRNSIIAKLIATILFALSFVEMNLGIIKYVLISTALLQLITRRCNDYVT